jgi:hypothetical protein
MAAMRGSAAKVARSNSSVDFGASQIHDAAGAQMHALGLQAHRLRSGEDAATEEREVHALLRVSYRAIAITWTPAMRA